MGKYSIGYVLGDPESFYFSLKLQQFEKVPIPLEYMLPQIFTDLKIAMGYGICCHDTRKNLREVRPSLLKDGFFIILNQETKELEQILADVDKLTSKLVKPDEIP